MTKSNPLPNPEDFSGIVHWDLTPQREQEIVALHELRQEVFDKYAAAAFRDGAEFQSSAAIGTIALGMESRYFVLPNDPDDALSCQHDTLIWLTRRQTAAARTTRQLMVRIPYLTEEDDNQPHDIFFELSQQDGTVRRYVCTPDTMTQYDSAGDLAVVDATLPESKGAGFIVSRVSAATPDHSAQDILDILRQSELVLQPSPDSEL